MSAGTSATSEQEDEYMDTSPLPQSVALALAPKGTAILSIVGSSLIVSMILSSSSSSRRTRGTNGGGHHRRRRQIQHIHGLLRKTPIMDKIMLCMSICDILVSSFCFFASTWPIPRDTLSWFGDGTHTIFGAVGNNATCNFAGFFGQFQVATPLYNLSLGIFFLLTVHFNLKEWQIKKYRRREWSFYILPFGFALFTSTFAVATNLIGHVEWTCWILPPELFDEDGAELTLIQSHFRMIQWLFLFGPVWVCIIILTAVFVILYRKMKQLEIKMARYVVPSQHLSSSAYSQSQSQSQSQSASQPYSRGGNSNLIDGSSQQQQQQQQPDDDSNNSNGGENKSRSLTDPCSNYETQAMQSPSSSFRSTPAAGSDAADAAAAALPPPSAEDVMEDYSSDDDDDDLEGYEDDEDDGYEDDDDHFDDCNVDDHGHGHDENKDNGCDQTKDNCDETQDENEFNDVDGESRNNKNNDAAAVNVDVEKDDVQDDATLNRSNGDRHNVEEERNNSKSNTNNSNNESVKQPSTSEKRSSIFSSVLSSSMSFSKSIGGRVRKRNRNKKKDNELRKARRSREIAIQGMWYVGVFYITWVFPTISRVLDLTGQQYFAIQFLDTFLLPLQGFLNFCVYVRPRIKTYRKKNPTETWFQSVLAVVSVKSSS